MNVDPAELRNAFSENVRERFGGVDTRMLDGLLTCLTNALQRTGLSVAPVSATNAAEFESAFADGVDEGSLDLHIRASALAATRGLSPEDEPGYLASLLEAQD